METPSTSTVLVMLFALLFIGGLEFGSSRSIDPNVSCIESERAALVKFKQSLIDESNRLSSWVGEDCRTWKGVSCSKKAGHVVKLDLHNPTLFDVDSTAYYFKKYYGNYYFDWMEPKFDYVANHRRTCLGGEINPSLLNLKHLHYLDLSMNNFSSIQIPEFLGSLKNLRYLNLSSAGFGGNVPHHLGNLSSLQFLDLGNSLDLGIIDVVFDNYLTVDSLRWVSTLSSLKHLYLTTVDLSEATDWLHAINMLPSLLELNLAYCWLSPMPPLSHVNFTSLVSLDLSWTNIESFPLGLSNISGLVHLNLDGNNFGGPIPDSLGALTSLSILDLSNNNFFGTSMPNWLCKLDNLVYLDLSDSALEGSVLPCFGNLTSLVILNLHFNFFNGSIPSEMGNTTQNSLKELKLQSNEFSGSLPIEMGNFQQLTLLDLSDNEFEGEIPDTMRNLCSLRILDLSYNKFGGEVPIFVRNPFGCPNNSLKELYLQFNEFSGPIPDHFRGYKNLEFLFLSDNSINGPIPESIGALSSLKWLYIDNNQLNGSIPSSFGQLSKLQVSDISFNSLADMLYELHFAKLASLKLLYMSLNSLVLNVSSKWVPPFQLEVIDMADCKLGPEFPSWLQTQRHVKVLDISNVGISDTIPDWFEDVYSRIDKLDMSFNQISGKLPKFPESNGSEIILKSYKFDCSISSFPSNLVVLDLSNNLLSGHIPLVDDNRTLKLATIILSNNSLTGGIPTHLCNIRTIQIIDFSKNKLSGRLPWCFGELQELLVLDLTNNSLSGDIPSSLGYLRSLLYLHLHNNMFHGKLPPSLKNLTNLYILDLGKNEFSDIIPPWIGEKLSDLKFLSLQSNKFNGDIPAQLCCLFALQVLNLAQNNLTGKIPHCFGNFIAMVVNHNAKEPFGSIPTNGSTLYQEKILDTMKGRELEFTSTIPFLTSIDLSENNIVGEIPEELMDLSALLNLNLAGNHLEGRIPKNIGNLKQLENLDLSRNELSGPIPQSMSALNFLSHLNLSFNNLSGRIPHGNQLQTLDLSIYIGNNALCGAPHLKSCAGDKLPDGKAHVGENKGGDDSEFLWFYAGIGPGFLVGFLGVCGILHFKKSWRYAYFQLVDNIYNWLLVAIEVKAARLRRKFHKGEVRG